MKRLKEFLFLFSISLYSFHSVGQISNINNNSGGLLTDMIDTTTRIGRSMLSLNSRFGKIGFSAYMQPQFQWAESKGAAGNTFAGGDFGPYVNSRFRLRRGRFRTDFSHFTDDGKPSVYFVFQFDGTERGVNIRDFWGRIYENKWELFHFSTGVMARPFGHEVLLSSAFRESPERGRMSQILMPTERDLGMMVSLNPRKAGSKFKWLAVDVGIYDGQGLTGTAEYDNHKDIIARISSKRRAIGSSGARISWGLSGFFGGITSQSAVMYSTKTYDGKPVVEKDSSSSNIGRSAGRKYFGADVQLIFPNKKGQTEFRAEYMRGSQTATAASSTTPGSYPVTSAGAPQPLYTRAFDGAYFYFLQHLGSPNHQLILKYDWYNPNTNVKGKEIDAKNGFSGADIRFDTFGGGYIYYVNQYLKLVFWYDQPINEKTAIKGYENDVKDGVFTFRTQFNF
ncbi:porin [Runella sp.]|uniref:porin n=1 Tax=Runella sp. TaxID=1960881 RepID=UPI003D0B3B71